MEVWDSFEDLVKEWNDKAEASEDFKGIRNMRFNGGLFLAFAETDMAFLRGAISGIAIAIIFSFLILLLSSLNII